MKDLHQMMQEIWKILETANIEINSYLEGGVPELTRKRLAPFMAKWEKLKTKCDQLYSLIEEETVTPVLITIPWEDDGFQRTWQEWKDYVLEQHHRKMKSRMEKNALAYLQEISNNDVKKASEYLRFAMANGYPRFFRVTEKNYEQPTSGGNSDGDF